MNRSQEIAHQSNNRLLQFQCLRAYASAASLEACRSTFSKPQSPAYASARTFETSSPPSLILLPKCTKASCTEARISINIQVVGIHRLITAMSGDNFKKLRSYSSASIAAASVRYSRSWYCSLKRCRLRMHCSHSHCGATGAQSWC